MRPEILFPLFADVGALKGVGPRVRPLVLKVAGPLVRDLLFTLPHGFIRRDFATMAAAVDGAVQTFAVQVDRHVPPHKIGVPYKIRAFDETGFLHMVFFRTFGSHLADRHPVGAKRLVSGKVERFGSEVQVVHPDHIVDPGRAGDIPAVEAVYPATAGLTSRQVRKLAHEALDQAPELPEWQDPAWRARHGWPGWREALVEAHAPDSEADLSPLAPARARLAYDELLAHQLALGRRRQARRAVPAPVIRPGPASAAVEAVLPFALTGAQARAVAGIRADLASGERMGRLLQGDVGSGKTAVALLAMADAAASGFQSALMAPTEILARQHHERLAPWLEAGGIACVLLTGRDKGAARADKLRALAEGTAAVAIGTHALFQESVAFRALALAVVDEQHRFGVAQRNLLQAKGAGGAGVHLLSMSATPIPRTLELTQYGDLEVSRLDEKPPGRKPVATRAVPSPRVGEVLSRLQAALDGGAQAYWICPLVAESEAADLAAAEARAAELTGRLNASMGLVHGQMPPAERDAVMSAFAEGRLSLLVATTVVEVGVDVPRATIMVIEQAERFGLAQLHQLRGRVGRGAAQSACILLYDPPLSEAATARLEVLRSTEDGFVIAEQDWALRGGGDPLGLRQAGLPAYRLADPVAHRDLLLAAADDARLVLGRDPELTSPRGRALRVLTELFDWRPDRSDNPD